MERGGVEVFEVEGRGVELGGSKGGGLSLRGWGIRVRASGGVAGCGRGVDGGYGLGRRLRLGLRRLEGSI